MASTPTPQQPEARAAPARPHSLKERQRQERERLILQAAMELLVEKGYHETAMEEIAARVGISKGAVYLHFPSKEDLVAALFERGARAFTGVLNETLSAPGSPREKLGALVEQIYGAMGTRFQLMSAALRSSELLSLLAARHDAMAALWEEPSRRVAAVIDEGKRRGEFDPHLPTPLAVALLWSLLSPRGYQQLTARDGMAPEDVVRHLRRCYLKGIAADAAPPAGGGAR